MKNNQPDKNKKRAKKKVVKKRKVVQTRTAVDLNFFIEVCKASLDPAIRKRQCNHDSNDTEQMRNTWEENLTKMQAHDV